MTTTTEENRRKAGGPETNNIGAPNATPRVTPAPGPGVDESGWETTHGLRVLHADVDSLLVTANFCIRYPVRRDLQRAQALAALAQGGELPVVVDDDTGETIDVHAWEELRPIDAADQWEEMRAVGGAGSPGSVAFELGGILWRMEHHGMGGYRWFLRSEFGDLWLNPEKTQTRPAGKVRLAPQFIASAGALPAWQRMHGALRALSVMKDAGTSLEAKVQRIDIKVDYLGGSWLGSSALLKRMVTRAVKSQWHMFPYGKKSLPVPEDKCVVTDHESDVELQTFGHGKRETGWVLGRKDNIQVGCYDKTFEIGAKNEGPVPTWQRALWAACGAELPAEALDPRARSEQHVWRLEARFSSHALRAFYVRHEKNQPRRELESVTDVLESIGDLWRYVTEGWLRVVNRTATRLHRCPTNAVWRAIATWPLGHGPEGHATFANPPHVEVGRAQAGMAKVNQATSALMGSMASILAAVGPAEALALARKAMPEATVCDAVGFLSGQVLLRHGKRKAVSTVADRLYGEALKKEARLSVTMGARPTMKLQEMIFSAAASVTDADADSVLYEKIAEARKERERRKKKALEVVFEGCDLTDPAIRVMYEKAVAQQEKDDLELRSVFDSLARDLLGLEDGADVRAALLGEQADA